MAIGVSEIVLYGMLAAGAAYAMHARSQGGEKPKVTSGQRKVIIVCAWIFAICAILLLLAVFVLPKPQH